MRDKLVELIIKWMKENDKVVFLTADIGGGVFKILSNDFPERCFNVGIAEQNMIGMAAGLCNMGFRVICYSKACFISLRTVDQIKNMICYPGANVVLIGADAGCDEIIAGTPHTALEDIGAMRLFHNMNIFTPSTEYGMEICMDKIKSLNEPSYIRIDSGKIKLNETKFSTVTDGIYFIKEGVSKEVLYISYGYSTKMAHSVSQKDENASVLCIDYLNDKEKNEAFYKVLSLYKSIIVMEEQFESNGLYNRLCHLIVRDRIDVKSMQRIGPEDAYPNHCIDRRIVYLKSID